MTEASWTPEPSDDKLHDECGVFGVWAPNRDPARMAYFGLRALQHRGQESAGIAVGDGRTVLVRKDLGLVTQVFSEADLAAMPGKVAIGHCRRSSCSACVPAMREALKFSTGSSLLNRRIPSMPPAAPAVPL